jgi:hypothetical protein
MANILIIPIIWWEGFDQNSGRSDNDYGNADHTAIVASSKSLGIAIIWSFRSVLLSIEISIQRSDHQKT